MIAWLTTQKYVWRSFSSSAAAAGAALSTYGIAALLILVVGPIRLLYFEKPPLFYLYSAPFLVKMAILVAVGLLSIYPTLTFLSWRKATDQEQVLQVSDAQRKTIERLITIQIVGIGVAVSFAAMAAKGIGVFGP